jgi:hypothetical protein
MLCNVGFIVDGTRLPKHVGETFLRLYCMTDGAFAGE